MSLIGGLLGIKSTKLEKVANSQTDALHAICEGSDGGAVTPEVFGAPGVVGRPAKSRGVRIRIGNRSIVIAVFNYAVKPPEHDGETKVYATDATGAEKVSQIFRANGKTDIENAQESAAQLFSDLIDKIAAITTVGSAAAQAVSPASIAELQALKARFSALWG